MGYLSILKEIAELNDRIASLAHRAGAKKDQPLSEKAKENLKENTYKDYKTKVEVSFSTAFKKQHPKALKDYQSELSSLKKKKPKNNSDYGSTGQFSAEVKVALQGAFSSASVKVDIEALSIPQELGMRAVINVVVNINAEVDGVEPPPAKSKSSPKSTPKPTTTPKSSPKSTPKSPVEPKERKKRLAKRIKEELPDELKLPDGGVLPINKDTLSNMTSEQAQDIRDTLETRAEERSSEEPTSKQEEQKQSEKITEEVRSSKIKSLEGGADLADALNRTIDKMFEGQTGFLSSEKVRTQKSELKQLTQSVAAMSKEEVEEVAQSYEKQGEQLIQSFTDKEGDYEGLVELQKATAEILKAGPPQNPLSDDPDIEAKLLCEAAASKLKDIDPSQLDAKTLKEYTAYGKNPKNFKAFAEALEKSKWMEDNLDGLQADVDEARKKALAPYRQQIGKYLAAKAMEEGFIREPMYGVKTIGKTDRDDPEVVAHRRQVRINQARRYQQMPPDVRNQAEVETQNRLDSLEQEIKELKNDTSRKAELEMALELRSQYQDTLAGLNTAKLMSGDKPMEGFNEVDPNLLALAKQVNDDNLLEAISVLGSPSGAGRDREQTREALKSALSEMSIDRFTESVGDTYGEMADLLSPAYCPNTPANEAAGVADKTLSQGEKCPEPLDPRLHDLVRRYMTDSFVDTQSILSEDSSMDKEKRNGISDKQRKDFKSLWENNKEEVLKSITMDENDPDYDEEKVASTLELFGLELRIKNYEALQIDGKKIIGHEAIMKYLRKVQEMDKKEREKKVKELAQQFEDFLRQENPVSSAPARVAGLFNKSFIGTRLNTAGDFLMKKRSTTYVDYQSLASDFEVGMSVYTHSGGDPARAGIVVAVFPAIGMVDVQFPHGSTRIPVEDLLIDHTKEIKPLPSSQISVPGGAGTQPVSLGIQRVASAYMDKVALYWWSKDRVYRKSKGEVDSCCPKCKRPLKPSVYKRRNGKSDRLLVCTSCVFVIKTTDIVGG